MNKIIQKLTKLISIIFLTTLLNSCETVSAVTNSISQYTDDSYDYIASLFSSDDETFSSDNVLKSDEMQTDASTTLTEIKQESPISNEIESIEKEESDLTTQQNLVEENISEEILESVEVENIDVNNLEEKNGNDLEYSSPLVADIDETTKIKKTPDLNLESKIIKKLKLKNKIQFKIATINFNSGSSSINKKGYNKIKKVLKLANDKNAIVKIVGHASTRTKDMDILKHKMVNFVISDKRAQAVASVFVKNKFPLNKLITEAVSDSKPLFHEVMPAGTSANQRTEIYLIY